MKRPHLVIPWNSIRFKISFGMLMITLTLIALMIVNNVYAINVVRNQVALSNSNLISLYMGQIDNGLKDVDQYLLTLQISDDDFKVIENSKSPDEIIFASAHLQETLSSALTINKFIESFFIYNPTTDNLIDVFKMETGYAEREQVRGFIRTFRSNSTGVPPSYPSTWFLQKIGADYYLFRFLSSGTISMGAWVNMKTLQTPVSDKNLNESGSIFFTADSGQPINHTLANEAEGVDFTKISSGYFMTGTSTRYLVVGKHSNVGDFSLVALIPDKKILEDLPSWIRYAVFILLGFIFLLPGFFVYLQRIVIAPLARMATALRKFGEGDAKVRIDDPGGSDEFKLLNASFNRMAAQIEELKIHVYEEQISKQRIELQHLQLQINPHFFMNSLNIIYTSARAGKYELIQEMTLCLVRYFRYMFRSNLTLIALKDELEHVRNYLRIQEIRYPNTLRCHISVPETLLDIKIPPLVIHTFVENTIIHQVSPQNPIEIGITIELDESEYDPYLLLVIRDTGHGFTGEVLSELRSGHRIVDEEGEHIGIWNVMQRLRLLYAGRASIDFANADGSGAVITLRLPILISEEEEHESPSRG